MPLIAKQMVTYPLQLCDEALNRPWYIAVTQRRKESVAITGLTDRRIACWLPVEQYSRKVNGSKERRISYKPLMPNYIFVSIPDECKGVDRVRETPGISRMMTINERPVLVESEVMWRMREAERDIIQRRRRRKRAALFDVGQRVRFIESRNWSGLEGEVKQIIPDSKGGLVTVKLERLGTVLVSAEQVKAV